MPLCHWPCSCYPNHALGQVHDWMNDIWLSDMKLVQAGSSAILDRYIGYYEPYATSHEALDCDTAVQAEVRNVAQSLADAVKLLRDGRREPGADLEDARPK